MVRKRVFLTVPQGLLKEPLIWKIGQDFEVVTNIRGASVTEEKALLALLLEGDVAEVDRAVLFLRDRGVQVQELEEEEE